MSGTTPIDTIIQGDCLEEMKKLPGGCIDMILCDLPYGTTACKWDHVIPFEPLWKEYKRLIKDRGAIVLTANEPFATVLRMSNLEEYRYDWIWDKKFAGSFGIAKFQPMRVHENVCVFYKDAPNYNPQMAKRDIPIKNGGNRCASQSGQLNVPTPGYKKIYTEKYPESIIEFNGRDDRGMHPTQKPVALFEYLIKTYTNEGDLVLDNCIGSGTTAVAAKRTGRHFIGIELSEEYCEIARKRVAAVPARLDRWAEAGG